jgi:hypothetical protein
LLVPGRFHPDGSGMESPNPNHSIHITHLITHYQPGRFHPDFFGNGKS